MSLSTQQHIPIQDIKNDALLLKDGSVSIILQTTAVNFDLLSENEQLAIIASFAGMLNSLSFAIQIVVRSKRLDISAYLQNLDIAQQNQKNPQLKELMKRYRAFVSNTIKENEVLDKQFYIVISVSSLELGLIGDVEQKLQKASTILIPRRDHIIKQIARIGLKATQIKSDKLVRLFYDYYNEEYSQPATSSVATVQAAVPPAKPAQQSAQVLEQPLQKPAPVVNTPQIPAQTPVAQSAAKSQPITPPSVSKNPIYNPIPPQPVRPSSYQNTPLPRTTSSTHPFVVEELQDDYGVI